MNSSPAIILDTDIGYDPDDLFALIFLNKLVSNESFKLLITANEIDGKRAIFAKYVLNKLGNTHTKVCIGSSLGLDKFTVNPLIKDLPASTIDSNYLEAIKNVVDSNDDVIFIGIGGFSNFAHFIQKFPEDAKKMKTFIMGGAVNYERYPDWVEYNVKIDIDSAGSVVRSGYDVSLIMAQTTHNPVYEINENHPFYKKLSECKDPALKILYEHCRLWFEKRGHGTAMHDPLTVATALGYNFVTFNKSKIIVSERGVFLIDELGNEIKYSDKNSDAEKMMNLLSEKFFK